MIKSLHVIPGVSHEASGPSYSVVRLCKALMNAGGQAGIMTLDWGEEAAYPFIELNERVKFLQQLGISPALKKQLGTASKQVDIIHNHSLWMMPNVYAGQASKTSNSQLVVSPRGTLSPYALGYSKWAKKIFWALLQKPAIRKAACFHATSQCEYEQIRMAGLDHQPICIIPNGVDIPDYVPKRKRESRKLLFLGRIHPIKGIDNLLYAWKAVQSRFPDWELQIAGPDNGNYLQKMQLLAHKLRLKRVVFCGPLYGEDKLQAYRDADLFILPSHSENFGMTVAEALAAGTPAIVTQGAPWEGLDKYGSGWWIEQGVDSLVASLDFALNQSRKTLGQRGLAGREWMENEFSWDEIGVRMHDTYHWLLNGGETPDWISLL